MGLKTFPATTLSGSGVAVDLGTEWGKSRYLILRPVREKGDLPGDSFAQGSGLPGTMHV